MPEGDQMHVAVPTRVQLALGLVLQSIDDVPVPHRPPDLAHPIDGEESHPLTIEQEVAALRVIHQDEGVATDPDDVLVGLHAGEFDVDAVVAVLEDFGQRVVRSEVHVLHASTSPGRGPASKTRP